MPYGAAIKTIGLPSYDRRGKYNSSNAWYSQAGLAVKTYLSDRFNNWLNTEWIDGTTGGINAITAVDVTDGKLTMDALILQKKIFNMLNRVAITDGTYQAWREATYGIRSATLPESHLTRLYQTQQQTRNRWEHLPGEELQPCINPEEV